MTLYELIKDKSGFNKQSARTWAGPCPKCGGTDRCIIWIHKDMFKCRVCEFKGGLIKWLREVEGYKCREAHIEAGIECESHDCPAYERCKGNTIPRRRPAKSVAPPAKRKGSDWEPREYESPADLWRRKGTEFVDWAHQQLLESPEQLEYLAKRGLPLEAVKRYRLGFNPGAISRGKPGPLFKQREAWGLEKKRDDVKNKWITVFPIQRGHIIPSFKGAELYRIRIRRLDEDLAQYAHLPKGERPPKYLFVDGSGKGLVVRNPDAKAFLVVESDFDDLLLDHVAGDIICPVALTTCGVRPDADTAPIFARALCILNALDYDARINELQQYENPGGQNARWWQKHFPRSERWPVPVGKDPGEAWQAGINLRQWVIQGLPVSLQPKQSAKARQEEKKMSFNAVQMEKQMKDTMARITAGWNDAAWDWAVANKPEAVTFIKEKEVAVNDLFAAENEAGLVEELDRLERAYRRVWRLYQEQPLVVDVNKDAKGESNV